MFAAKCSFTKNDPLCMAYHPYHFVGEVLLHPVYPRNKIVAMTYAPTLVHLIQPLITSWPPQISNPPSATASFMDRDMFWIAQWLKHQHVKLETRV